MRSIIGILATTVIAAAIAVPASLAEGEGAAGAGNKERVVIDGVDNYRVVEPLFEAVRVVLSHRGETYSPEYIQGISGAAFRIAGICPCAPTSSGAMATEDLPRLLGYDVKHLTLESCGVDWKGLPELLKRTDQYRMVGEGALQDADMKKLRNGLVDMISQVKEEIRQGRPVVLWHAFTNAEFDVVTGFDETKGVLIGRGAYVGNGEAYATAAQFRTLTAAYVGGWPAAILIGKKSAEPDLRAAEVEALREAVKHAYSSKNTDKAGKEGWALLEGLACYDQWIRHFGDPAKKRGSGDAYCYGIYRDTHRAASVFLREIAPKHPAGRIHMEKAADHFLAEADTLKSAEALMWWQSPEGPDAARNEKVVKVLTTARGEYASGIEQIELALASIDKK